MIKESELRDYFRAARRSNVNQIVNNQIANLQNPSKKNFQKHLRTVVGGAPSYKSRLAGHKDLSSKFREVDDSIEASQAKTAHWNGFIKAAQQAGLNARQTLEFVKYAQNQIPSLGMPAAPMGQSALGIQPFTNSAPMQPQQQTIPPAGGMPQQPQAQGPGGLPMPPKQIGPVPMSIPPRL